MSKNSIPDRWMNYTKIGSVVENTRFICFKVPLNKNINARIDNTGEHFTMENLVQCIHDNGQRIGMIIDLTNTTRYYNPSFLKSKDIEHTKILTEGHIVPSKAVRRKFFQSIESFLSKNKKDLIGIHCTHGVNRTGYLVCKYMITHMNIDPKKAIADFNKARGHDLERSNYIADLWNTKPSTNGLSELRSTEERVHWRDRSRNMQNPSYYRQNSQPDQYGSPYYRHQTAPGPPPRHMTSQPVDPIASQDPWHLTAPANRSSGPTPVPGYFPQTDDVARSKEPHYNDHHHSTYDHHHHHHQTHAYSNRSSSQYDDNHNTHHQHHNQHHHQTSENRDANSSNHHRESNNRSRSNNNDDRQRTQDRNSGHQIGENYRDDGGGGGGSIRSRHNAHHSSRYTPYHNRNVGGAGADHYDKFSSRAHPRNHTHHHHNDYNHHHNNDYGDHRPRHHDPPSVQTPLEDPTSLAPIGAQATGTNSFYALNEQSTTTSANNNNNNAAAEDFLSSSKYGDTYNQSVGQQMGHGFDVISSHNSYTSDDNRQYFNMDSQENKYILQNKSSSINSFTNRSLDSKTYN